MLALMQGLIRKRTVIRTAGIVFAIAIAQYMVAFFSWSLVPGNAVPGSGGDTARIVWVATSFPLFWIFQRNLQTFQILLICNAVLWGFTFGWLGPVLLRRSRKTSS
jgi:hypothetical protein